MDEPIRIGISACLLGQEVRYDGGHTRSAYIVETLGKHFEWVPVCPEVEFGLGTPREPIRLERGQDGDVQLVSIQMRRNMTSAMRLFAKRRVELLAEEQLAGYLSKKDSPSCGVRGVKIHDRETGVARREGRGLFVEALAAALPNLPIEDECEIEEASVRENWMQRVLAYHALQQLWRTNWTVADLAAYHTRHPLAVTTGNAETIADLKRLLGRAHGIARDELQVTYESRYMVAIGTSPAG